MPTSSKQLLPKLNDYYSTRKALEQRKLEHKKYYDRTAKSLPSLHPNDPVRVLQKGRWEPGVISDVEDSPRSYQVRTPDGSTYRRNRRHLLQFPKANENQQSVSTNVTTEQMEMSKQSPVKSCQENPELPPASDDETVRTRSGRIVKKPKRFGDCA